jgi:TrmH family RNA methyltransferase
LLSSSNARLAAARRLTRRQGRRDAGRFLAEGPQAVGEALRKGAVIELFGTAEAIDRNGSLLAGVRVDEISARDAATLSETVNPQGLVAVCELRQPSLAEVLAGSPRLLVALVAPADPGNLGTIIRTADAAGADAVLLDGGVDPYNGKAVRASAGSLFHLPVVLFSVDELLGAPTGLTVLATTARGTVDLDQLIDDRTLAGPTVWILGSEPHGLPDAVMSRATHSVRIPVYGRAESLNLAAAAAICLYASARAQR